MTLIRARLTSCHLRLSDNCGLNRPSQRGMWMYVWKRLQKQLSIVELQLDLGLNFPSALPCNQTPDHWVQAVSAVQ